MENNSFKLVKFFGGPLDGMETIALAGCGSLVIGYAIQGDNIFISSFDVGFKDNISYDKYVGVYEMENINKYNFVSSHKQPDFTEKWSFIFCGEQAS